jgi:hypothetical protein
MKKIKKIGRNRYKIGVCDEDINKGLDFVDLGEDGDFIVDSIVIETDDKGFVINPIEIIGLYKPLRGKVRKETMYVWIDRRYIIHIDEIKNNEYTAGEIVKLPWIEFQI